MIPLSDNKSSGSFPFWTLVIIAINVFVFFLEYTSPNPDGFIAKYALIPSNINLNDYSTLYPLITSQFLHAGFLHIISNMWFLWIFGNNVEGKLGFFLFPIIYLASGAIGALGQYLILPDSTVPMLGASGAVAGILGAYFAYFPKNTVKTIVPIFGFFTIADLPASLILVYWFITQIFAGTAALVSSAYQLGGVAYFAHIAGFVFGFLTAKLFSGLKPQVLENLGEN